jgi:hypothetical protein
MKKITLLIALMIMSLGFGQSTVNVSASDNWIGYMNVFQLNGTSFEFGQAWGVADLKTVVSVPANTISLSPNFNTYNAADPFWSNGAIGNKICEANTYVENNGFAGQVVTFKGKVISNNLAAGYTAIAFIKAFAADYSSVLVNISIPLTVGEFSITTTTPLPAGSHPQYGFQIKGLNGNPVDEVSLGKVVVGESTLSTAKFETSSVKMYPNPVRNTLTIDANSSIQNVSVYNILGQEVMRVSPKSNSVTLQTSDLQKGAYMVRTEVDGKVSTNKVIKE